MYCAQQLAVVRFSRISLLWQPSRSLNNRDSNSERIQQNAGDASQF